MAKTAAQLEREKPKGDTVTLRTGEQISREAYGSLSRTNKAMLQKLGVEGFQQAMVKREAKRQAKIAANYVILSTGEPVLRTEFEALTPEEQVHLQEVGVEQFTAEQEAERKQWEDERVKLDFVNEDGRNEWVLKEDWDKLTPEQQAQVNEIGTDAFNAAQAAERAEFEKNYVELDFVGENGKNEWVDRENWDKLTTEQQAQLKSIGTAAFNEAEAAAALAELEATHVELDFIGADGKHEWVDKENWNNLTPEEQAQLSAMGVSAFNDMKKEEYQDYLDKIAVIEPYKVGENSYNLVGALLGGISQYSLYYDYGFSQQDIADAVLRRMYIAQFAAYKTGDKDATGNDVYNMFAIRQDLDSGVLSEQQILRVFGSLPPQYLSVAQVAQIRNTTQANAYQMGDAWGVSHEQVDQIRSAPDAVAAEVYAYLQANMPNSIALTHQSQLPSVQSAPSNLNRAFNDYQAVVAGTMTEADYVNVYGADTLSAIKSFTEQNVEVSPNRWIAVEDWEVLTPEQQAEVKETGSYTIDPYAGMTGEEIFQTKQKEGEIHELAEYKGYDEDTKELSFLNPKYDIPMSDIMLYWSELEPQQQRIQINLALGRHPYDGNTPFDDLTDEEKKKVLRYYLTSYFNLQMSLKGKTEYMEGIWEEEKLQLKEAALGMIPIYGTIRNWDNMSPVWRGISIAMDVAFVLPFAMAGVRAIKAAVSPLKASANAMIKSELAVGKEMAQTLAKSYQTPTKVPGVATLNRELGNSYLDMLKAQGKYINKLVDVAQTTSKGKALSTKLQSSLLKAEGKLRTAAKGFVLKLNEANSFISKTREIPVRFDSPEVAKMMSNLPDDIVRNSKSAVRGLQVASGDIKALTRAVASARTALDTAKARYPKDASKWADLISSLYEAEGKLYQAQAGSLVNLYDKLLATRRLAETAPDLYKQIAEARSAGKASFVRQLERRLKTALKAQAEARQIQIEFDKAVKTMEVEWGRGGFFTGRSWGGRGGVAVGTKVPFKPSPLGLSPALLQSAREMGLEGGMRGAIPLGAAAAVGEVVAGATPSKATLPIAEGIVVPSPSGRFPVPVQNAVAVLTQVDIAQQEWATPTITSTPEVIEATKILTTTIPKTEGITADEIEPITAEALRIAIDTITSGATDTELIVDVRNKVVSLVNELTDTRTLTEQEVRALTSTIVKLATDTALAYDETITLRGKLPPSSQPAKNKEGRLILPIGSYTWKQGIGWRSVTPPFDRLKKPLFSKLPPKGAKVGGRTPQETIQLIGSPVRTPKVIHVDLGVSDIYIKGGKRPTIEFGGGGLKTDVGKRIPSNTQGLSLGDEGGEVLEAEEPLMIRERPRNAPPRRSQVAKRAKKKMGWLDQVATVKGYRPGDF